MQAGRGGQLVAYLLLIAANLLVLPNWFRVGAISFGPRLILLALNVLVIAYCAWRASDLLGWRLFGRAPKEPSVWDGDEEDPRVRRHRRAEFEAERHFGQSETFEEYDPYDEAPPER